MHSGILYLFPFIGEVCMGAAMCHSLDFHTYGTNKFHCYSSNSEQNSTVTFWSLFFKVIWPCFLWGTGTAIGEIPPYAVALATKKAGKIDDFTHMQCELEKDSSGGIFTRMKLWMIKFLETYGFWAVLAFAAWPNMAFDMCGIVCGHFEMPFWTFFSATFIGKAIIKVSVQAMFFVFVFNEKTMNAFIDFVEHNGLLIVAEKAKEFFEGQRSKFLQRSGVEHKTPLLSQVWMVFVTSLILLFVVSIIQNFAQQKQREIDDEVNERWMKSQGK